MAFNYHGFFMIYNLISRFCFLLGNLRASINSSLLRLNQLTCETPSILKSNSCHTRFFVCKVKYQRVIPWYANRWQTVQKHPTSVKYYLLSGNDLKTVLFLYSAFLCVLRFSVLASFVTVTTLMLRRLASFLLFFEVIPAFFRNFVSDLIT
mgnify:CR=1 FL=1